MPTTRRRFVETCRHHALSPARWDANDHLTQWKVCGRHGGVSSGEVFGRGCSLPTQSILHTTVCALNCCFYFLSSFSFEGWRAGGQLEFSFWWFSSPWNNEIIINYGSQIRAGSWPLNRHKDTFHLPSCLLFGFLASYPWKGEMLLVIHGRRLGTPKVCLSTQIFHKFTVS